jgi:hypothetical protein
MGWSYELDTVHKNAEQEHRQAAEGRHGVVLRCGQLFPQFGTYTRLPRPGRSHTNQRRRGVCCPEPPPTQTAGEQGRAGQPERRSEPSGSNDPGSQHHGSDQRPKDHYPSRCQPK